MTVVSGVSVPTGARSFIVYVYGGVKTSASDSTYAEQPEGESAPATLPAPLNVFGLGSFYYLYDQSLASPHWTEFGGSVSVLEDYNASLLSGLKLEIYRTDASTPLTTVTVTSDDYSIAEGRVLEFSFLSPDSRIPSFDPSVSYQARVLGTYDTDTDCASSPYEVNSLPVWTPFSGSGSAYYEDEEEGLNGTIWLDSSITAGMLGDDLTLHIYRGESTTPYASYAEGVFDQEDGDSFVYFQTSAWDPVSTTDWSVRVSVTYGGEMHYSPQISIGGITAPPLSEIDAWFDESYDSEAGGSTLSISDARVWVSVPSFYSEDLTSITLTDFQITWTGDDIDPTTTGVSDYTFVGPMQPDSYPGYYYFDVEVSGVPILTGALQAELICNAQVTISGQSPVTISVGENPTVVIG